MFIRLATDWPKRIEAISQMKMIFVHAAEFFETEPGIQRDASANFAASKKGEQSGVKESEDAKARKAVASTAISYL